MVRALAAAGAGHRIESARGRACHTKHRPGATRDETAVVQQEAHYHRCGQVSPGMCLSRLARLRPSCSNSDEVGNGDEQRSDGDKQHGVGHEVRKNHEDEPADQGNDFLLLLAIDEEAESGRAEEQAP